MTATVLCIGKMRFAAYRSAADEYLKRLRHYLTLRELELKTPASPHLTPDQIREQESRQLMQAVLPATHLFVLDERGKHIDSMAFAALLGDLSSRSQDFAFVIGGAYGHHDILRSRANTLLALSQMTFPHELARVLLYEQIYRAMTILKNEPYHK